MVSVLLMLGRTNLVTPMYTIQSVSVANVETAFGSKPASSNEQQRCVTATA